MEQLPKIVGQRLQAVKPQTHPDANLLGAFAEKSLLPREQTSVLEHLAACADCREVVAHAQPEEILQKVAVARGAEPNSQGQRSWFGGIAVRWAALAACVVVVGTVVISRVHFSSQSAPVASKIEPFVVAKNERQEAPIASTAEQARSNQDDNKIAASKAAPVVGKRYTDKLSELDKQQAIKTLPSASDERRRDMPDTVVSARNNAPSPAERQEAGEAAGVSAQIAKSDEEAKASKKKFSADKAMKIPMATETVEVQAMAPPPPPSAAKPATDSSLADSQRAKATAGGTTLRKSKDGYGYGGIAAGSLYSAGRLPIPQWQLSSEGRLIKSNDQGVSWQPVPVSDRVVFRALCVTDREVWVGGAQGVLFYSSNAGQSWEQVKPSASGKNLSADITAIAFTDPLHGKVTTVNRETWTTSDGGHVWQVETR